MEPTQINLTCHALAQLDPTETQQIQKGMMQTVTIQPN